MKARDYNPSWRKEIAYFVRWIACKIEGKHNIWLHIPDKVPHRCSECDRMI